MNKRKFATLFPFVCFFFILCMPADWLHMPGLTVIEQRVVAIFFLAALCWVLEPIPIFATSVLIIVLELLLISNKGLAFLHSTEPDFGKLLRYQDIMATFASPIIMLFLGGFFLAMAATKYRLDINLARVFLKPFGKNPYHVLLGLMLITTVFSMFMSNTATTAMMLSILTPVLMALPDKDPGRIAYVLAIPLAANIGGIATPIGTPPNAVALEYLMDIQPITFGGWMLFGVPFVLVLLFFSWWLLRFIFPIQVPSIELDIKGRFMKNWQAIVVYVTFAVTVLCWMGGNLIGLNSEVVALIPVAVFVSTKIITREDMKTLSWDVLWLVSGGIALGLALQKTGLAARMVSSVPFDSLAPVAVLVAACSLTLIMANFMSHTATANLLLPLMAVMSHQLTGLEAFGGSVGLLLAVTFAASLGMSLPISTPPNALASATGMVHTKDMAKIGIIVGIVGMVLTFAMLLLFPIVGS